MAARHRVNVSVQERDGTHRKVLTSTRMSLPQRLLKLLFGDFCQVLVLTPERNVESVEIHEIREEGESHDGKE